MASTGFPTCTTLPGVWIRNSSRTTASGNPFFPSAVRQLRKCGRRLTSSVFSSPSGLSLISISFFYQFFRYQASQKFLFYNRYRLFFTGSIRKFPVSKKSICLLYLPLIFKRDRINIPSAKSEGLGCTPQCIKCTVNPCHKKQKCFHRHGPFRFQCLIDPAYHKAVKYKARMVFARRPPFFSGEKQGCHKKRDRHGSVQQRGKIILKGTQRSRQDTKRSKGVDNTHLKRFPVKMRNFPTSLKKHIIHKEIRHKNDIYVYILIHKTPPLLFYLPLILNFGKYIYYRAGSVHILSKVGCRFFKLIGGISVCIDIYRFFYGSATKMYKFPYNMCIY